MTIFLNDPVFGLAAMTDYKGHLERPLADDRWPVPDEIELQGDRLSYRWGALDRSSSSGKELLGDFVRLVADPDDEAVLTYARRWGVLELCEHGMPATHGRPALSPSSMHRVAWCEPLGFDPAEEKQVYWEPLAEWRRWSGRAGAILKLAAQLHTGNPTQPQDWRTALDFDRRPACGLLDDFPPDWTGNKWHIAQEVNGWLALGQSRFAFDWGAGRGPAVTIGGGRLFGALAAQMMLAVARSSGLAVCSGCAVTYFPERKPSTSRRSYCQECRARKIPDRDAHRAQRTGQSRPRSKRT